MKRVFFLFSIIGALLFALLSLASCDDKTGSESILSFDRPGITFEAAAGNETIKLTTNAAWHTVPASVPEWITLAPASGDGSKEITVSAKENESFEGRSAQIIFVNGDNSATLKVSQSAEQRKELAFSRLRFSWIEETDFTIGENGVERRYAFTAYEMFVNPEFQMTKKIFLGNLVNPRMVSNTDISEYTGYTFNPITVSTDYPSKTQPKTYTPSRAVDSEYARRVIAENPKLNERFLSDLSGAEYGSRRELHLIGMGNMAMPLDEVISGKSYREQEMAKRCGVIYSFYQSAFTLAQDLEENIVQEELNEKDFPAGTLAYVNSVSYGRVGLLVVESNHNKKRVGAVVKKIIEGRSAELSDEDKAVLCELDAYHIYFDGDEKMKLKKGKEDSIRSYAEQIGDGKEMFAFKFTVSDYFDRAASSPMTYRLILP